MNQFLSPHVRTLLVQSIGAVEQRKPVLQQALSLSLSRSEQDPELSDQPEIVAGLLLDLLIAEVRREIDGNAPADLAFYRRQHRSHDIDGRHYSRFGEALVAVVRDILGPVYPRETGSAWSEAFWTLLQRLRNNEEIETRVEDSGLVAELIG